MKPPPSSPWSITAFRALWIGQTASQFGSQVTLLALPLVAVVTLRASAFEVAAVAFAEHAALVVCSLFAGVVVDRTRTRTVLIVTDVVRCGALLTIPIAAASGNLTLVVLYFAAVVTGASTVFFQVAYQAYVPAIVTKEQLVSANSALEMSASSAQVIGPALAGLLVAVLGGATAVAVDAATFALSAAVLLTIPSVEAEAPAAPRASIVSEALEGLRYVRRDGVLRGIAIAAGIFNLWSSALFALYVLYISRELGMTSSAVGAVFTSLGVGLFIGAILMGRIARRWTVSRILIVSTIVADVAFLFLLFAGDGSARSLAILLATNILAGVGIQVYNITTMSLRQRIVEARFQGRVSATLRLVGAGLAPVGIMAGGVLASNLGIRTAVAIAAVGMSTGFLAVAFSSLAHVKTTIDAVPPAVALEPMAS